VGRNVGEVPGATETAERNGPEMALPTLEPSA